MFDTILIANRGEIACRVMETAQAIGVRCVAVYSDADAQSKHVAIADAAAHIGGSAPAESYLRGDAIIQAACDSNAQAIHPGYGFLSENPDFVEAVEAAGLTFIGPSAAAIRAMGLKDAAKALMIKAGLPVVPGYHGSDQTDDLLSDEAEKIGYPVLIKAVAGGGGKGMRLVERAEGFGAALESARSEARTAFGNPDVLVEKFVSHPRHIEVQVFGDGEHAVHLFERDCSLQRRHQKVIEEAPAPGMTDEMRTAMGAAAVQAAEAIGYKGAGTVEFIVDGSGPLRSDGFYFMEMNTRLQVEHPVTECITGIDLVEWQLRVAAGGRLPVPQEDLTISGHAFEARLYAEDVPAGFLPATGKLTHLSFPATCRADSGVRAGDEISPFYDPMIAKVIVHGSTRDIALQKLSSALRNTQVTGTKTNLAFLGALAGHQGFCKGDVDTGLIGRDIDALKQSPVPEARHAVAAAMALSGLDRVESTTGFHLWQPLRRTVPLLLGEEYLDVTVEVLAPTHQKWIVGGQPVSVQLRQGTWWIADAPMPEVAVEGDVATVFDQYGIAYNAIDLLDVSDSLVGDGNVIEAPMPGLVKAVLVEPGAAVSKGDRLAILEAMKMEHALLAARDGTVIDVLAIEGDQVTAGAAIVRLEDAS